MDLEKEIAEGRREIDRLDEELIRLLNRRAQVAIRLLSSKRQAGLAIFDPKREAEILQRARALNAGPLDGDAVARIVRTIVAEVRQAEEAAADGKSVPDKGTEA